MHSLANTFAENARAEKERGVEKESPASEKAVDLTANGTD